MRLPIFILALLLTATSLSAQFISGESLTGVAAGDGTFQLPDYRVIPWAGQTGLDPASGIPSASWTENTCSLLADGVTNERAALNTCITNAAENTVVKLPCGEINTSGGNVNMKSNVALRGCTPLTWANFLPNADLGVTTLLANGDRISFDGGSKGSNWGSDLAVTAGYTKGSVSLTLAATTGLVVGDWISLFQNEDTSLMDWRGFLYLGEDCNCSTQHAWQQYTRVTAINGNVITISPAVYQISPTPTGVAVREQAFNLTNAGIEDLRIKGSNGGFYNVVADFSRNIWIKGIESYGAGTCSGCVHIMIMFSANVEVRDSAVHDGGSFGSGANYGINFYFWNSAHKVENNTIWHTRHSIIFEAGTSGSFIGYNYSFDNDESEGDIDFLSQDCTINHGANPMMNLWEGNHCAKIVGDYTQGSGSYMVLFRNYANASQNFVPSEGNAYGIGPFNRYYSLVGNVAGRTDWGPGTPICDSDVGCTGTVAFVFGVHTDGIYMDAQPRSTAYIQGNYDYGTDGVSHWDSDNHNLASSLYYSSKPSFMGACTWPPFGPDVSGIISTLPAKHRFDGTSC